MDQDSNLNSQSQRKTADLKVKKWRFKFPDDLETKDLEEALKTTAGERQKGDKKGKPPLSDRAEGFIIDENNKEVFVYFSKQLQFKFIVCYPYIKNDSLKPWLTKAQGFDQCVKSFEGQDGLRIIDLSVPKRKKEDERSSQEDSREMSKLQYKEQVKAQRRLEMMQTQSQDEEEKLVQTVGLRLLEKEKYKDIYLEYAKKKDVLANFIMYKNRDFFSTYEEIAEKILEEDSQSPCPHSSQQEVVPFKFENMMDHDMYKSSKANYADIVNKSYFSKKGVEKLDNEGWNYYLVAELASKGLNYQEVKETLEQQQPTLKADPQYAEFLKTLVKSTNAIAKKKRAKKPDSLPQEVAYI